MPVDDERPVNPLAENALHEGDPVVKIVQGALALALATGAYFGLPFLLLQNPAIEEDSDAVVTLDWVNTIGFVGVGAVSLAWLLAGLIQIWITRPSEEPDQ